MKLLLNYVTFSKLADPPLDVMNFLSISLDYSKMYFGTYTF